MNDNIEFDQKIFNKICDISEWLLDNGYAKAWFTWLEWSTITSALLLIGLKTKSVIAIIMALLSAVLLLFIGLVVSIRLFKKHFPEKMYGKLFVFFIVFLIFMFTVPIIVFNLLFAIFRTATL